jgi:hypothetical protein
MRRAAMVGVNRMIDNLTNRRSNRHGEKSWGVWQRHVEGAMAELAVAKYLGLEWAPEIGNISESDVSGIEVRSTHHQNGRLIIHKEDDSYSAFVLAIGMNGEYRLAGWCYAFDAKRPEFWQDPTGKGRPAYFVPQNRLVAMSNLRDTILYGRSPLVMAYA